jgi:glucosyl-dolichyl phosphate glucuronosyltransferase
MSNSCTKASATMIDAHAQSCAGLDITVILCTYNRAESLALTLESLAASQLPLSLTWEVLVVDNNSTDQTREVIENFSRCHPGKFRYLLEPTPGKSHALNTGIANARGEVLAFVDDDVTTDPEWLQNLTANVRAGQCAGAAGRVLPAQQFASPSWLSFSDPLANQHRGGFRWDPLGVLCAHFDLGDQPAILDANHPPYGANMAIRKSSLQKYGGFRLDLGPRPGSQIRNEDVELGRRLMNAGEVLRYEPSAVVYHPVPQARITKDFFLSWWFDFGRASILEAGAQPDVWRIPRDYLSGMKRILEILMLIVQGLTARREYKRFSCKCMIWKEAGMLVGLYSRASSRGLRRRAIP